MSHSGRKASQVALRGKARYSGNGVVDSRECGLFVRNNEVLR
jgi:hypothetical protein